MDETAYIELVETIRNDPAAREQLRRAVIEQQRQAMSTEQRAAYDKQQRLRAVKARQSLAEWCDFGPPGEHGPIRLEGWQRKLCDDFQAFVERAVKDPRKGIWIFIGFAPPQAGKSVVFSERAPLWFAAQMGLSVGIATYGASLAEDKMRKIKAMMDSPEAALTWPHLGTRVERLRKNLKFTEEEIGVPKASGTSAPATILGRGRDGALVGRTMQMVIMDDMFKNDDEYESAAARRQLDQFNRTSVYSRLADRGGILCAVGTRWGAEDNQAWWEKAIEDCRHAGLHVNVETFHYPVQYEDGRFLSERWDQSKLEVARRFYGRYAEAVLFGRVTSAKGPIWSSEHFKHRYDLPPEAQARFCERTVLVVDGAATQGAGDHTTIDWWGAIGMHRYLLGTWRGQWGFPQMLRELRQISDDCTAVQEGVRPPIVIEDASSGRQAKQTLELEMTVIGVTPKGSKRARWENVIPQHDSGAVFYPDPGYMPELHQRWARLIKLKGLPGAKEVDDEADVEALALHYLTHGAAKSVTAKERRAFIQRLLVGQTHGVPWQVIAGGRQ